MWHFKNMIYWLTVLIIISEIKQITKLFYPGAILTIYSYRLATVLTFLLRYDNLSLNTLLVFGAGLLSRGAHLPPGPLRGSSPAASSTAAA